MTLRSTLAHDVLVLSATGFLVWCYRDRWTQQVRALSWPLGLLVFLLPIGPFIEPWLQDVTAWFIRAGLQLTQIPYRAVDPYRFVLSSGIWVVAPSCGGLQYVLPGLALGYTLATLLYQHWARRLIFLAVCAVVLIVTNGVRAYAVIALDHWGILDGTNHRVFSYVLFGLALTVLLWLGLRWAERRTYHLQQA